jgi:hypothetical protein
MGFSGPTYGAVKSDLYRGASTVGSVATEGFAAYGATFRGFAFGVDVGTDIAANAPITAVRFPDMTVAAGAVTLRLKVFTRPLLSAGVANPALNNVVDFATDTLVGTYDYLTDVVGLTTAGVPNAASEVRLVLPTPIPAATVLGQCVYFVRQVLTAGGAALGQLGVGRALASEYAIPLRKRGWNQSNTSITAPTWSVLSTAPAAARRLAYTVETQQWVNGVDYQALSAALAGSRPSPSDRINQALDAYGNLKRSFNAQSLRNYHRIRRSLTRASPPAAAVLTASISSATMTVTAASGGPLAIGSFVTGTGVTPGTVITALGTGTGGNGTYTVNPLQTVASGPMTANAGKSVISLSGTSWTQNSNRWSGGFANALVAEQGDGGGGWTGFGFVSAGSTPYVDGGSQPGSINGNARSTYGLTYVGTWTSTNNGDYSAVPSPDNACVASSTAGDYIKATAPASPTLSGVDLFWIGTANGVLSYSWDNVSFTNINVQGTVGDCSFAALTGFPTSGAINLYLKVVSGTCKPAGVNWLSAASGVVVHKLGCGGHSAAELAVQAIKTSWQAAMARLGITTAQIMHGTNDQGAAGVGPATYASNHQAIVGGIKTALPGADIIIVMEAENARTTNVTTMPALSAAAAAVAGAADYAFYDLQWDFGDPTNPGEYQSTGARPLFNAADLFHPEPATGGRLIEAALLNFYNQKTGNPASQLSGTSPAIGGSALLAGGTATDTVNISGAAVGMAVAVTPNTYPGAGVDWDAYVSAPGVVTVVVTGIIAVTPTASTYNVRVLA